MHTLATPIRLLVLSTALLVTCLAPGAYAQWERIDAGFGLDSDYTTNLTVFDGTYLYATVATGSLVLFRSSDDGATWTQQTGFPAYPGAANFFVDLDGRLALGALRGDATAAIFAFSDDQGVTWTEVQAPGVGNPQAMARRGDLYLAGTASVMARSTDGGATWQNVDGSPGSVGAIAMTDQGLVAIGQAGFVYRSTDGGLTWSQITIDPALPLGGFASTLWTTDGVIYAKPPSAVLYASTDGGATWAAQPSVDPFTFTFVQPGPTPEVLLLHSNTTPLLSTDGGATATSFADGYPTDIVSNPCVSNFSVTDAFVIANAWACFNDNTGVYRQAYAPTTASDDAATPTALRFDAVYPNPTSDAATLTVSLDTPQAVRLAVYDVLGREVAVVLDGLQAAGTQTLRLDTAALAPGVYVARLSAGSQSRTRRLTVVR